MISMTSVFLSDSWILYCLVISSQNMSTCLNWTHLYPWHAPLSSWLPSIFWSPLQPRVWAALSLFGTSIWVHTSAQKGCKPFIFLCMKSQKLLYIHDCTGVISMCCSVWTMACNLNPPMLTASRSAVGSVESLVWSCCVRWVTELLRSSLSYHK